MLEARLRALISVTTLAARAEYRSELLEELRKLKSSDLVSRDELYEAFLQTYLFAGFPAALESVRSLEKVFGAAERSHQDSEDVDLRYSAHLAAGEVLYQRVYAANAPRVREEMLRLSPELAAWAMIEGYGKTLSRPNLDIITRELCTVAMLTNLGWDRQLYSHILGARNVGAPAADIVEAAEIGARGHKGHFEIAEQLVKKLV